MARYDIGGQIVETDGELSPGDIDQLAQQLHGTAAPPSEGRSVLGELGHSAYQSLAQVGQGVANLIDTFGPGPSTPEEAQARKQRRTAASEQYKNLMAEGPAVPTLTDIHSGLDAAKYAAAKLGGISPYALSMGLGFVPGAARAVLPAMAATGAVQGGEAEAEQPNSTPASIGTAGAIGGATATLPIPFIQGSGGVASRIAKNALIGGPVVGAAQGLTGNIPRAVASGNPADAIPDPAAVREAMIGNAIGMSAMGGAHAGAERILARLARGETPAVAAADDSSKARLAERIKDTAEQNELDLGKVAYDDGGKGAKTALDTVHTGLSEDIKNVWTNLLREEGDHLDPAKAISVEDMLDRSGLLGTLRTAKNKVKGVVGPLDIQALTDAVGHTQEGRILVDLVRQSNELSNLFKIGLKGGVSRFTDHLNPLGHGGRETGYTSILRQVAPKAVEAGVLLHNPAYAVPMVAGYAGGRAIDALTGRRSTVAKFVRDNANPPSPIDMTGAYSVLQERAKAEQLKALDAAKAEMEKQQDADRLIQRERELRTQNRLDNNPGLGGFDKSIYDQTGIRPNDAVPGVFELFRTGRITPTEFHSFFDAPKDLMAGNAGNHIIDMLDQMARKGTLQRDPEWAGNNGAYLRPEQPQSSSIHNPEAYAAQAAGNQARVTEAQSRVAASEHAPEVKQAINDAIAAVGRSNNRSDAQAVHDNLVHSLSHSPKAQAYARQEVSPLVQQIRHPLKTEAVERDSRGRPISRERLNPKSPEKILEALQALTTPTIKAFHGSPHDFAKFDMFDHDLVQIVKHHPEGKIPLGLDFSGAKNLDLNTAIPGWKGLSQFLTPSEQAEVTKRTASTIVKHFQNLPPATEMASVAYAGRSKRGWYRQSAKAIVSIFGQGDAPRFAALLAALSPQASVETNLTNALNVWRGWIEHDRPSDEASIMRILGENVEGDKGPGSVLPAWVNNSVRALTAPDGERVQISGPKVTSFALNLLGEVHEVTNDTWMANWAGINQEVFKGRQSEPDQFGYVSAKSPGYLAMNALTRKAAAVLTKRTGETWTPAEVQETVWSWAKAISEKANSKRSVTQLVKDQALSHDEINAVPDFEKLFVTDTYARILDVAGYGDYIDNLKYTFEERAANDGGNGPRGTPFSAEGAGISQDALLRDLLRSAKRLDALKSAPKAADVAQGEFVIARHPTAETAQQVASALGKFRPARVEPQDGEYAVIVGPKPEVEHPTAPVPSPKAFTDPEGRRGAASFIAGIEHPDGTTKGLTTPEIRAVAKSIARLVEGGIASPGVNGVYNHGNNTIHVYGPPSADHDRVLGHETGHAVEALSNLATRLEGLNLRYATAEKGLQIVKDLSAASRLERPHLWSDDKTLEETFQRPAQYIHEYRTRLDELFADAIRHYMTNPVSMKKVAPLAARFIRDLVNPSKIGKVIAFASIAGLTLPGIIAQALASFYQGGDQEDA